MSFDYWNPVSPIVPPFEECDDGNLIDNDGCDSDCSITSDTLEIKYHCIGNPSVCFKSICGNGVLEYGEECEYNTVLDSDLVCTNCVVEIDD